MPTIENYRGIIPAIACPFTPSYKIDEPALRKHASWLATQPGVVAVMTNGHTGEVFSLTPRERAEVTRIVADELRGKLPVISSIVCEGLLDAKEHAAMAKEAGAKALDVMPPHHWLRFGFRPGHVMDYFEAISEVGLDLVAHVYPAWTRASYSSATLAQLAKLPYVQAFKVGQRDMNKYAADIKAIRDANPSKVILTCHDEYLLATMVQGVDGALVGFATFIPVAHQRPLAGGEGGRSQARDEDPGRDHAAQGCRVRRRRAHRRGARAHEDGHVSRRRARCSDRASAHRGP